jgi:hypothetical protein
MTSCVGLGFSALLSAGRTACGDYRTGLADFVVESWLLYTAVPPLAWHAHEMLYGFITAATAGFLLTAIPSWTSQRGYAGAPLFGLAFIMVCRNSA